MKTKTTIVTSLILLTIFLHNTKVISQEWQWAWGKTLTYTPAPNNLAVLCTDWFNNLHIKATYGNEVCFIDTCFNHQGFYAGWANHAIAKFNNDGVFIDALDVYALPNKTIFKPFITTDFVDNIYLSAPFQFKVHISDTFLFANPAPYPDSPDVFVAKLNSDYKLLWGGLISSEGQDDLRSFIKSDNGHFYLAGLHYASGHSPGQINYLNQATSEVYYSIISSITKIYKNGTLEWKQEIIGLDGKTVEVYDMFLGDNSLLYFHGYATGHLTIGTDTLYHPNHSATGYYNLPFLLIFNETGQLIEARFIEYGIYGFNFKVDKNDNLLFTGFIRDTVFFGNDTIVVPPNKSQSIIAKINNQFEPIWYHVIDRSVFIKTILDDENLIFMFNARSNLQIADTLINLGFYDKIIIGEFNTDGGLIEIITTENSNHASSFEIIRDNCNDLLLAGKYRGTIVFNQDTLASQHGTDKDSFFAKLSRTEPLLLNLGNDTSACRDLTIIAPEGFEYYYWNDSLINENWLTVSESGTYHLACATEKGCWVFDTIHVNIHPGFEINLGPDTTIRIYDTIKLSVPDHFESYLWSDGTTSSELTIMGADYGIGTYPVWVQVTDGPCLETDTIYLTVKDEQGIEEALGGKIRIFPNPFSDIITIELDLEYNAIEVYDLYGSLLLQTDAGLAGRNHSQIDLTNLLRGVYLLKVKTPDGLFSNKIVKL